MRMGMFEWRSDLLDACDTIFHSPTYITPTVEKFPAQGLLILLRCPTLEHNPRNGKRGQKETKSPTRGQRVLQRL